MIEYSGSYTDQYQLAMAQACFMAGQAETEAVFDYFFRKLPFGGGYAVFAGLEDLLAALEGLRFSDDDIAFLRDQGFAPDFIDHLKGFEFTGELVAAREGETVFHSEPVVRVSAGMIEAQIVESLLLNILNYQTLVATKASRMRLSAGDDAVLVDFGLRRAPGLGGYNASRAAIVGGFDASSNVRAGRDYGIALSGTMAHSYIQSHDDELAAFRSFAAAHPGNCVLLVDTYDTLRSGVPNAIRVGHEMTKRGEALKAIRLDSGDLAWLARQARRMLDAAGLPEVKIAASNQLDEHVIKSLRDQGAPIDLFGVGTSLVTGAPDGALDGVYKLAAAGGKPRIKLSEAREKITLPYRKQVFRVLDDDGAFAGADVIALDEEEEGAALMHHPSDLQKSLVIAGTQQAPLLRPVMTGGRRLEAALSLNDIKAYCRDRLALLPPEYKRFHNPHAYKVGLSDRLKQARDALIGAHAKGDA